LTIVEGEARIEAGLDVVVGRPGTLLTFEPGERHRIESEQGAQVILILSSWPSEAA
jgi:quercetin dioxygenase-like cupin family protein